MDRWSSRRRITIRALLLIVVLLAAACGDDGPEGGESIDSSGAAEDASSGDASDASDSSEPPSNSATIGADGSSDSDSSSGSSGTTAATGSTTSSSTSSTSPAGPPTVRVGPITIERTDPCPAITVAPTFSLTMTSDAGTETMPAGTATQMEIVEGAPTEVAPDASFTVEGDWSLNVQMLEHLSGTTRGTTHTETSRLADQIMIDGVPIDISWTVTEQGDQVTLTQARFTHAPSCVQIHPGTLVAFTDADGAMTSAGSTDPSGPEPRDLPIGVPVTVFDGASFDVSASTGWTVTVNVIEHWNGRFYNSSGHTKAGSITEPFPLSGPNGSAWEIRYTIDGP